jgi:rhodanese-related sulfurtransferase
VGPAEHWDRRYAAAGPQGVSWFQTGHGVELELLAAAGADPADSVVDVGGGAGTLVDCLVGAGWSDVTVLDVSRVALDAARDRVGAAAGVHWILGDLLAWVPPRRYTVWHDRAVFHFLVDEDDRARYRQVLAQALEPGGVVVVGAFAADGPTHCSGLPVQRYEAAELAGVLGRAFDGSCETVATRSEAHRTPSGDVQPFTWVALRAPGRSAVDRLLAQARHGLDRVLPADLAAEMAAGALVVDIRPAEQRARDGELPGAVVIERNVLEWRLDPTCRHHIPQIEDGGQRVILVCNEGYGSSLAAATLRALGLRSATDLIGGFQAWRDS